MEKKKSLAEQYPELAKEWHPTKNGDLTPQKVTSGSHKKVWWMCDKGHEWEAFVGNRSRLGRGCPYCNNQKTLIGINDLATTHPELAKEWHPTLNGDLSPQDITSGSHKKVWWMCQHGHEWMASVHHRSNGNSCPYCSNKKVLKGFNDLSTTNPELAKEWHPSKNGSLSPQDVTAGSNKKVWWMCDKGHEWEAIIYNRANGKGCPYCFGRYAIKGETDLETTHPELVKEWHPSKNGSLTPQDVSGKSGKKVWWRCEKGHEWGAVVASRSSGCGCPECSREKKTSFQEQAIFYYLKKVTKAENRWIEIGKEIDVYLPEFKIGIEYNGEYYHKNKESEDKEKIAYFAEKGIRIITVKESNQNCVVGDTIEYIYSSSNKKSLDWVITTLFNILKLPLIEIDVSADNTKIYEQYIYLEKENSLAVKFPSIAKEWHPSKNGGLMPDMISFGSGKKVWWMCDKGHEWQSTINHRSSGCGCPECYKINGVSSVRTLQTTHPQLAKEWHPTKNRELTLEKVNIDYNKKVWWKCEHGHSWRDTPRRRKEKSCPICLKKKVIGD